MSWSYDQDTLLYVCNFQRIIKHLKYKIKFPHDSSNNKEKIGVGTYVEGYKNVLCPPVVYPEIFYLCWWCLTLPASPSLKEDK